MKFRIIKKNDDYIPQCRVGFIWFYFEEGYADSTVMRKTLKEAEDYIMQKVEVYNRRKNKPTVVKQFDL